MAFLSGTHLLNVARFRLMWVLTAVSSVVRQRNSYSRLNITQELFDSLMREFAIMPRFKEFVLLFGAKQRESEIGPPQMRFKISPAKTGFADDGAPLAVGFGKCISVLDRTSVLTALECAYSLRYVERTNRYPNRPWSVRQTVIYQRYALESGSSSWVYIALSASAELQLASYMKQCEDITAVNPFELHVVLLDTALATWRPYIVFLTNTITQQVCHFRLTSSLVMYLPSIVR